MLDIHNGLVQAILVTRHEHLVREQQMHRLATEARSARGGEQEVRPRRRVLARFRAVPATR
jgi:hypothetical protein